MIWCLYDSIMGIVLDVGLAVIIKPNATGRPADFVGQKGEIVGLINPEVCWVMVGEEPPIDLVQI